MGVAAAKLNPPEVGCAAKLNPPGEGAVKEGLVELCAEKLNTPPKAGWVVGRLKLNPLDVEFVGCDPKVLTCCVCPPEKLNEDCVFVAPSNEELEVPKPPLAAVDAVAPPKGVGFVVI